MVNRHKICTVCGERFFDTTHWNMRKRCDKCRAYFKNRTKCAVCGRNAKHNYNSDDKLRLCSFCFRNYRAVIKQKESRKTVFVSVEKICPTCKKPFTANRKWQRYCSPNCRLQPIPKKGLPIEKTCIECGAKFVATHNVNKKYCSTACCLANSKKRKKESKKKRPIKKCLWCHSEFHVFWNQKFCCSDCGALYRSRERRISNLMLSADREDVELSKLQKLGLKYQLPEREIIIEN